MAKTKFIHETKKTWPPLGLDSFPKTRMFLLVDLRDYFQIEGREGGEKNLWK